MQPAMTGAATDSEAKAIQSAQAGSGCRRVSNVRIAPNRLNDQAQRPPPGTPGRLQQSRTNYLNRPTAQRGGSSLQRMVRLMWVSHVWQTTASVATETRTGKARQKPALAVPHK
jgi:hypothetical protein